MMYDIYLRTVCYTQPVIKDLLASIPALKKLEIQQKLTPYVNRSPDARKSTRFPGFLGLNLEEGLAQELYRRLEAARGTGEVLPSVYREPKITQEQALKIAQQELSRICQQQFPGEHFGPIRLYRNDLRWWTFYTVSDQRTQEQEQIIGTGGPSVYVDKLDGHLWQWT